MLLKLQEVSMEGNDMKNVSLTKDISDATHITHGGNFHADEVFATVILAKVYEKWGKKIILTRADKMPNKFKRGVMFYDIGCGKYDHHQIGGNGERKNGVPYATCGLVWKKFGNIIVEDTANPTKVWHMVDNIIIQGIDAIDNGVLPTLDYPAHVMGVSTVISSFNPTWDSEETSDEAFLKALDYAETIFNNVLKNACAKVKVEGVIEEEIEKCDGPIMVMEQYIPWQDALVYSINPKAKDILFVVFPSNRSGYNWQAVPKKIGTFNLRKAAPKEWWGLSDNELRELTGVATAKFCHNSGFIGGCETLEDAIKMAELAVEAE